MSDILRVAANHMKSAGYFEVDNFNCLREV
jgi:hypothetical protein